MGTSSLVRVRRAGPSNADGLARVAAVTFPLACPPTTTDEAKDDFIARHLTQAHFERYLADPLRTLLVAEVDGVAVGYSMLVEGEPADEDVRVSVTTRPVIELSKFYLMPGLHGSGAAATLMAATIDSAESSRVAGAWLGVNQHNVRANRFYEKSGFDRVGIKRFLVGDVWEDDYVRFRPFVTTAAGD